MKDNLKLEVFEKYDNFLLQKSLKTNGNEEDHEIKNYKKNEMQEKNKFKLPSPHFGKNQYENGILGIWLNYLYFIYLFMFKKGIHFVEIAKNMGILEI